MTMSRTLSAILQRWRAHEPEVINVYQLDDLILPGRFKPRPWVPKRKVYSKVGLPRERNWIECLHLIFSDNDSIVGETVFVFILLVTTLSCISFILESEPVYLTYSDECRVCEPLRGEAYIDPDRIAERAALEQQCKGCDPYIRPGFNIVERFSLIVFLIDYGIRLFTAHQVPTPTEIAQRDKLYLETVRISQKKELAKTMSGLIRPEPRTPTPRALRRQKYMKQFAPPPPQLTLRNIVLRTYHFFIQPLNLADFIAVAPYVLTLANFAFLRVVRLFRAVRVVRLNQLSDYLNLFVGVIRKSFLDFLVFFIFSGFGMIIFASLAYYAERGKWDPSSGEFLRDNLYYLGPPQPSPFTSIAQACWWILVTFATVGYGDLVPTTPFGRFVGVIAMYSGSILIAMPITIMGLNIGHLYLLDKERRKKRARVLRTAIQIIRNILRGQSTVPMRRAWNTWRHFSNQERELELHPGIAIEAEISKLLDFDRALLDGPDHRPSAFALVEPTTEGNSLAGVDGTEMKRPKVVIDPPSKQSHSKHHKSHLSLHFRHSSDPRHHYPPHPRAAKVKESVSAESLLGPTQDEINRLGTEVQFLKETVAILEGQIAQLAEILSLEDSETFPS
eukprot:c10086_g1_i2.p1 GENE.c10086_g1_i2~~c10086_g1_i2.p1  ORF type:complete len:618 (+),score=84.45 c10086_g1_i2:49-1902(+)